MRTSVAVMMALLGLCGAGLSARPAVRADPGFDPAAARQRMVLPTTKVMVLGLSHLDRAPKAFDPAWLEPVLCRLRAYAPDVILTEAMSGEQLAGIAAYRAVRGNADKWAGSTGAVAKSAQQALAIGPADALATANMLSARPDPAPADRRRLAALFLAAGEPFSAATQWLQLPPTERIAGDGVIAAMKTAIEQFGAARSELASLAVALAVQLKRPRVYSAGDHLSDAALPDDAAFDAALKANPAIIDGLNKATAELAPFSSKALSIDTPDRVLPAFRALNSARFGQLDAQAQWLSLQQSPTMGAVGRQRVAAWEAQNLRMATTIREVTAPIPGGKALLVVGAAHKPFIEAYLRTMTDIEILSVPAMLDATPAGCR